MVDMQHYYSIVKLKKPDGVCSRCLCDTSISSIRFDTKGVCNLCHSHDRMARDYSDSTQNALSLENIVIRIKKNGIGKDHDCIVGVSGGTDSSYLLYYAKEILHLRPLAVHFDNGWNTDESVSNIKKITDSLKVDLETVVADWEEFREIQKAFLKASVPCIETPTDVAIHGVLFRAAAKEGIKYILGGQNFKTEGTVPKEWGYLDGTYIKEVVKKFGIVKINSFPNLSLIDIFYFTFLRGIRQIPILNFIDYDKVRAKTLLADKFRWVDYGGHHYENKYSKFAFGWYLPVKFGIDKRKISFSGPVRSGLMSRESALVEIKALPEISSEFVQYIIKKLGFSQVEFPNIMNQPNKSYLDYHTSDKVLRRFSYVIYLLVKLGFFPKVLFEKYIGKEK